MHCHNAHEVAAHAGKRGFLYPQTHARQVKGDLLEARRQGGAALMRQAPRRVATLLLLLVAAGTVGVSLVIHFGVEAVKRGEAAGAFNRDVAGALNQFQTFFEERTRCDQSPAVSVGARTHRAPAVQLHAGQCAWGRGACAPGCATVGLTPGAARGARYTQVQFCCVCEMRIRSLNSIADAVSAFLPQLPSGPQYELVRVCVPFSCRRGWAVVGWGRRVARLLRPRRHSARHSPQCCGGRRAAGHWRLSLPRSLPQQWPLTIPPHCTAPMRVLRTWGLTWTQ